MFLLGTVPAVCGVRFVMTTAHCWSAAVNYRDHTSNVWSAHFPSCCNMIVMYWVNYPVCVKQIQSSIKCRTDNKKKWSHEWNKSYVGLYCIPYYIGVFQGVLLLLLLIIFSLSFLKIGFVTNIFLIYQSWLFYSVLCMDAKSVCFKSTINVAGWQSLWLTAIIHCCRIFSH